MKRHFVVAAPLLLIGFMSAQPSTEASGQSGSEWTTLFDGSTLDGWNVLGDASWTLVDGAVEGDGDAGFLVTAESYGDFQLTLEFWIVVDSDSGVFIWYSDPNDVGAANSYEVNIADTHDNEDFRTRSIVRVAVPAHTVSTVGQWNTYDITARGERLTVILNGVTTADVAASTRAGRSHCSTAPGS